MKTCKVSFFLLRTSLPTSLSRVFLTFFLFSPIHSFATPLPACLSLFLTKSVTRATQHGLNITTTSLPLQDPLSFGPKTSAVESFRSADPSRMDWVLQRSALSQTPFVPIVPLSELLRIAKFNNIARFSLETDMTKVVSSLSPAEKRQLATTYVNNNFSDIKDALGPKQFQNLIEITISSPEQIELAARAAMNGLLDFKGGMIGNPIETSNDSGGASKDISPNLDLNLMLLGATDRTENTESPPILMNRSRPKSAPQEGLSLANTNREEPLSLLGTDPKSQLQIRGPDQKFFTLGPGEEFRYFHFKPQGSTKRVPGRIVEVQFDTPGKFFRNPPLKYENGFGMYLYAEWIDFNAELNKEVLHSGMLSLTEFQTIENSTPELRLESADAFYARLTPNQVAAQALAKSFGLKTHGRFIGRGSSSQKKPVLITDKMSSPANLGIRSQILEIFGSIDEPMLKYEKSSAVWNVLDVFSRLPPDYVCEKYYSPEVIYLWVINEDGQLSISPGGKADINLLPQILRLAHGRMIYASGTFRFRARKQVIISYHSSDYLLFDQRSWGRHDANENIDDFVQFVFKTQANVDFKSPRSSNSQNIASAFQRDESPSHSPQLSFIILPPPWDDGTLAATPLDYPEWPRQIMHLNSSEIDTAALREATGKLAWAHYIAGTHGNMSYAEIKRAYRRLQSRFATRTTDTEVGNPIAIRIVNSASEVFFNHFKAD